MISRTYLAGVMDSDGHLGVRRIPSKNGSFYYSASVVLQWKSSPESDAILEEIHEEFGGHFQRVYQGKHTRWSAGNRKAAIFIRAIRPYLRIKRRHADLLMELQRAKRPNRGRLRPVEYVEREEAIYREVRGLNSNKGPG